MPHIMVLKAARWIVFLRAKLLLKAGALAILWHDGQATVLGLIQDQYDRWRPSPELYLLYPCAILGVAVLPILIRKYRDGAARYVSPSPAVDLDREARL